MELKDGKIVISNEEKKILGSDEGKKWLTDNKFMIETVKEVDKPLTAEAVKIKVYQINCIMTMLLNS